MRVRVVGPCLIMWEDKIITETRAVIIDLPVLFWLHALKDTKVALMIPDSLYDLLERARDSGVHRDVLIKLVARWAYRRPDEVYEAVPRMFSAFDSPKERQSLQMFTIEGVDRDVYNSCFEHLSFKEFEIEFSPKKNIGKDIIAKQVGASAKKDLPILMRTKRTPSQVRRFITTVELAQKANDFLNRLTDNERAFLRQRLGIPVEETRGLRWFRGFVSNMVPGVGLILSLLDG